MGNPEGNKVTPRARKQEFNRLKKQLEGLKEKYPEEVYTGLAVEPSDVLKHAREVIRFNSRSRVEEDQISWKGY